MGLGFDCKTLAKDGAARNGNYALALVTNLKLRPRRDSVSPAVKNKNFALSRAQGVLSLSVRIHSFDVLPDAILLYRRIFSKNNGTRRPI